MPDYKWLMHQLTPDPDPAVQFWLVFARFEYALKGEHYASGTEKSVTANWDKFAADFSQAWKSDLTDQLKDAADYVLAHPPREQVLQGGTLAWADDVRPAAEPELKRLLLYVRRIRNNLFHGGKFAAGPMNGPERDTKLINSGLVILDACLSLCQQHKNEIYVRFMETL
jgi:hypothetical protein